jgi:FeS assembly protein IscX
MALDGFEDTVEHCNERVLEAIQMAWLEEFQDED